MTSKFLPDASLGNLIAWTRSSLKDASWLFVTLDSNPNVADTERTLSPVLKRAGAVFSYAEGGLWLTRNAVETAAVQDAVIVPFSACYVFEGGFQEKATASFSKTTDSGQPFSAADLADVASELGRLGAVYYAADGCGLAFVTLDEQIGSRVPS